MDEDVFVCFKGHELQKSDLEFLKGPCCVPDHLINFYFCLLSKRFNVEDVILFVPPSISLWIAICNEPEDIAEFVGHLDLRAFVLFPMNNNMALEGMESTQPNTHLNLFVHNAVMGYFIHFHEKRGHTFLNGAFANQVYKKVKSLVQWNKKSGQEQLWPPELIRIKTAELAKGFNKYDWGLHVMTEEKIKCEWYVRHPLLAVKED